jgi:hypothetical protein
VTEPSLIDILRATLLPRGFTATKSRGRFVRTTGGMRQVVGLRKGHGGDGRALWFHVEDGPPGSLDPHELSPVAPFKNTWWWPSQLASHDAATLVVSIENQVLPWFDAWAAGFDPHAALASLHGHLAALADAQPPFIRMGDTWSRMRGPVVDLADVEPVGGGVFAFVYVANWHAALGDGFDAAAPDSVTRIASTTLGEGRLDGVPNTTLFHLGADAEDGYAVPSAQLAQVALRAFDGVLTVDDVRARIRPEYRHLHPS